MNNGINEYQIKHFPQQFTKACEYRGKTYEVITAELNIGECSAGLIGTGEVIPDIITLIALANYLKMDLCYFFMQDANPKHFDLAYFSDL